MKNKLTAFALLILCFTSISFAQITINGSGSYATIQAAINAASSGDIIYVSDGTYVITTTITVNKSLTIQGQSEAGTIINANANGASYAFHLNESDITLTNFTILPPLGPGTLGTSTGGGYAIHASKTPSTISNITITNLTVENGNRTGIDLNGVNNAILNNITSKNAAYGNGISLSGVVGASLSNITTGNNAWGGIAVYVSKPSQANRGSNNVTIDATTCTIPEWNKVYVQDEYSLVNTNTTVTGYDYLVKNNFNSSLSGYTLYVDNLTNAVSLALVFKENEFVGSAASSYIQKLSNSQFYVESGMKIQPAVNAAVAGNTINVGAGVFDEDLTLSKTLNLIGSGVGTTTIRGVIGGSGSTIAIAANNVEVSGLTITRLGNNTTDWNDPLLNSAGISIQGTSFTGALIHDNLITGNRTGIDINNSLGHTIRNNRIINNRTGLIFRNQTDNLLVTENEITNNWTVGIVFLDASGGTNSPVQTALNCEFSNNNISGNWYGQIVERQTGGSLPAPGTTNLKNFIKNWLGTSDPTITTANSAEPGYSAQIPVEFGGSATPPVTPQTTILGAASANVIYAPYLSQSTDLDVETTLNRGTYGFQGDLTKLSTNSTTTTIEDVIQVATPGSTIEILPGTYEAFDVTTPNLTLIGNGALINHGSPAITVAANNTTITGFAFDFGTADYAIQVNAGVTGTVVSDCNFNVTNGIDNQSTNPVNAEYNYWGFGGNTSGPTIATNIGGTGSVITEALAGTVDYNPWVGKNSTPLNAATSVAVNTASVTWDWLNFFGPNFAFQLDFDGVAGSLVNTSVATNSAAIPTPLTYNTTYRWFVRSIADPLNTWIGPFTFTTQNIPAPVLTAPANTLTGVPILPTFSWTWSGIGAVTYRLEVSTSNTFATTVIDTTGLNTLSLLMPEYHKLANNITYYWRVTVIQGLNTNVSAISSFKTTPVVSVSPINPINGSAGVYFDPTYFSFQIVNGFTGTLKYLVQYRVNATVPTIAEWAGANTFTLTNLLSELPYPITLLANSKYYWRVVVLNASDEVVSYSGNYYFTTKSGAPTPYLSYPIGGQPVATNSPSFYWYIGTYDLTNITFDLEIATDAAFTLNHQTVTNINGLQYDWGLAPLTPGTTYYWRVTTWYKKGNVLEQHSSTSSYSTFKAMGTGTATTPYLSYPVGGLSIYTTTPTLYWYTGASTDGVVFDVYIKLSSAGGYTQIADNTSNLYFDMSGPLLNPFTLAAGSTYNWYVVATGGNGSVTSGVSSFVVNSSVGTGSVIASWPVGNPYVYSLTPTLYWYMYGSQTGLTKYVIKYSQTNSDLTQGAWTALGGGVDLALSETSYTIPTNLTAGLKYYWAIAGYNGGSLVTSWSTGSFTVSTTTTAVNVYLSTPVGGTTVYTLTPTLYWYATGAISGITSYDITYSNTSNFLGGLPPAFVTTVNTGTDNFYTLPSNAALAGATIYWKVTVNYAGGPSTSTTGSFIIDPGSSNVVPLVGSPINNTELKATAATLSWFTPAQSKAKLSYTVEYSESNNFANSKIASGLSEPQLNISGLKENTTYYWRAKSVDPQGTSSKFSEVALFRTSGKVTGVEEQEIPSQFELSQNYPNPFNPTTVISYALPKNTFVTIKVYDMLGREVKTLVNKENAAGRYSVDWNGDDNFGSKVSTGAYVYRITAGDFVSVKKMILIK